MQSFPPCNIPDDYPYHVILLGFDPDHIAECLQCAHAKEYLFKGINHEAKFWQHEYSRFALMAKELWNAEIERHTHTETIIPNKYARRVARAWEELNEAIEHAEEMK